MLETEKCGKFSRKWRTVGTPTTDEVLSICSIVKLLYGRALIYSVECQVNRHSMNVTCTSCCCSSTYCNCGRYDFSGCCWCCWTCCCGCL